MLQGVELEDLDLPIEFGTGPMILRALRIGRVLRLVKKAKQL